MGVVYRATQLALGRPVAVKAIAPELVEEASYRERFKRESQLAASIDHPNIIRVYAFGEGNYPPGFSGLYDLNVSVGSAQYGAITGALPAGAVVRNHTLPNDA